MAERLAAGPRVSILNDVVLNQVVVRFEGPAGDTDGSAGDARTRAVIDAVQRDGTCWLGGTTWAGRAAMRVSVSGWQTTADRHRAVRGRDPALPRRGRSRGIERAATAAFGVL